MATSALHDDEIAIVGMACRVPGANSTSKLWENLVSSKDVQTEITRFNSAGFYHPNGGVRKGLTNVKHAYFIDGGVDRFDNGFFSIPPLEATAMDPQQRILLEVAYEAIENAGFLLQEFQGSDTAVYAGIFGNDYGSSLLRDLDATQKYQSTGTSNSIAANRLSYFFDLHGPSIAVDTACSSTMVALHQAALTLRVKEAKMALVVGSNLIISPDMFIHMSELGFLSPSGRCRSFDSLGDGYARGEGVLALMLKPLGQAMKDRDPIRAVIKGTRINQDGRTQGINLPSAEAQRSNLEALYKGYRLALGDIQYLEAHGTGTAAGDPLELSAIETVFRESHTTQKLIVGSVKSNIGHLESCAALAGIVKTVECLERGQIPPQMHFKNLNSKIDFRHVEIPTSLLDWPPTLNNVRRAAVNSFGFGGTNGHAVLEYMQWRRKTPCLPDRLYLFKVSAASETSLVALAKSYADYIESSKPSLLDLSYTLLSRRSTLKYTLFFTGCRHTELLEKLRGGATQSLVSNSESISNIGFVFTGQGAQWVQMGKQLVEQSPLFKDVLRKCDRVLSTLPDKPCWSIIDEILKPKETSQIYKSNFSQPLCIALQLGLITLWGSWGVSPSVVVGHSSGEISAAYAAGYISFRDAIIIAYYRGLFLGNDASSNSTGSKGAMCAIGLSDQNCEDLLTSYVGRVALAAVNSPSSCTLSGDEDAIKEIVASCAENGTFCRSLQVDMAYHSHHMLPLAPRYEEALLSAGVGPSTSIKTPACEMFSSVTRKILRPSECTPSYWKTNMVSPVYFTAALTSATESHDLDALLELGPHPALKGPVKDTLAALSKSHITYFTSCFRGKPDFESLLESVGEMMNSGLPLDTSNVNALEIANGLEWNYEPGQVLTDIPGYQWDHSASFWGESRISQNARLRQFPRHEVLGARTTNDSPLRPTWRNLLMLKEVDWLKELKIAGVPVFPSVFFVLMAIEASRQIQILEKLEGHALQISNMQFREAIPFAVFANEDTVLETHFNLSRCFDDDLFNFEVLIATADADQRWHCCCLGTIRFVDNNSQTSHSAEDPVGHDPDLVRYVESFGMFMPDKVEMLSMTNSGAHGYFGSLYKGHEKYHLDPLQLAQMLELPAKILLGSSLPASYKLRSIDLLKVPSGDWKFGSGNFDVEIMRLGPLEGTSNLLLYDENKNSICIEGMHLRFEEEVHRKPPLNSLFHMPVLLPDITLQATFEDMTIDKMLELVTHKWPMSDIGIAKLKHSDFKAIVSRLKGINHNERSRFRSLNIVSSETGFSTTNRVRVFEEIPDDLELHLLFANAHEAENLASRLRPGALACVPVDNNYQRASFNKRFDCVCVVTGFESGDWLLGRLKTSDNGLIPRRRLKILADSTVDISALYTLRDFDHVLLDKETVNGAAKDITGTDFDVIVMDCDKSSMLASWPGDALLAWIQPVLQRAVNLLWITNQQSEDPFSNMAQSLVRTIQSEQPTMRLANLHFEAHTDAKSRAKSVFEVYDAILNGLKEVELVSRHSQIHILRYHPDDELSASVGLRPPTVTSYPLGTSDYLLSLCGPEKAVLLSERSSNIRNSAQGTVRITVEASVIDCIDALNFGGKGQSPTSWKALGQFFAGRIVSDDVPGLPAATLVVGWHPGAHRSQVETRTTHVRRPAKGEQSPVIAAVHYAAYSIALATIEGTARARAHDSFEINVPGVLGEALREVCGFFHATFEPGHASSKHFTVNFNAADGLLLNGQHVSVESYMNSENQVSSIDKVWPAVTAFVSPIKVFELQDYQKAFENSKQNPVATVLAHYGMEKISDSIRCYTPGKPLLRNDSAYVIVGGLGGLGRYISRWMVSSGAKNVIIVSRSGIASDEARQAVKDLDELGGSCDVITANASDSQALAAALASVRKKYTIRGVINMAMVLEDSPLTTMEGAQWDRALRVKIDSTWNLHQSTLSDPLEFFIMFSSISSIVGNRMQANYASGNAFQNAMAKYRRSMGLTAVAIALGAVSGIGVLANDEALLRTLSQSGLSPVGSQDLVKILEAAILESHYPDRLLLCTGLEMFETLDDKVQSKQEQNQLYWTEQPEFGFLLDHKFSTAGLLEDVSVTDQLRNLEGEEAHQVLLNAFLGCLCNILGYERTALDPTSPIAMYGLDSLNAVSCRYWVFKEIAVDVPVFDILGCKSINSLVSRILKKFNELNSALNVVEMPQPVQYTDLDTRPLSHSQRRLWFLHRFLPDKTIYNLLLVCHVEGLPRIDLFAEAWSLFIQRHEVLHSKIVDTPDGMQQIPVANATLPLLVVESSDALFQHHIDQITFAARNHEFDLETGELIKGWLLKGPSGCRFFLASHHLAWDRASVPTIFDETSSIYRSLAAGKDVRSDLPVNPYQFIDYTLWQNSCLSMSNLVEPHLRYWIDQLDGIPEAVSLLPMALTDRRPTVKQHVVDFVTLQIDSTLTEEIKAFCKQSAATPFMFMASAISALVYRLTGDKDIVIGIADGDRGHSQFDRLVGFTVNMLAIRSKLGRNLLYTDHLENYRNACLQAYEHRSIPFDFLLQQLDLPRRTSHTPVFQITVNYQIQGSFPECDYGDFRFSQYDHYNARTQSDFGLDIEETASGELHCVFDFDVSLYSADAMSRLAELFKLLCKNVVESRGSTPIDSINIVSSTDANLISSYLQPSHRINGVLEKLDNELFPTLYSRAIQDFPDKIALIDESRAITYMELGLMSNCIANRLIRDGAKVQDRIGVFCEQSIDMVVAMYGIIAAGCVYVPIDPDSPEERISSMIEDTELERVLVDDKSDEKTSQILACGINVSHLYQINQVASCTEAVPKLELSRNLTAQDPFCCIFTSGSTGRPKGIYIQHGSLRYQMKGFNECLNISTEDRILLSSAMIFDLSLPAIYGTVLYAATMIIASREARYSPSRMIEFVINERVTHCIFTPTQLKMLFTARNVQQLSEWVTLRTMVLGGEQIAPWLVREFYSLGLSNAVLWNGYAPAETTVVNALKRLQPEDGKRHDIPVGKPLWPSRFHVLDENMQNTPLNVPGELFIGGPTVNKGYIKRDKLTAKSFVQDPFASQWAREAGFGKLYRTGDLFRLAADGTIHSLGRIGGDRQVKIRGIRTELGEIENTIQTLGRGVQKDDSMKLSLVAVVYRLDNSNNDGLLVAYLTTVSAIVPDLERQRAMEAFLRVGLKAVLPVHMIPSTFVYLSDLPLTATGKTDYKALLAYPQPQSSTHNVNGASFDEVELTPFQSMVASIWKQILGIDGALAPSDDFFALGGHSLLLMHVQSSIADRCGVSIPLADMFAHPTLSEIGGLLASSISQRDEQNRLSDGFMGGSDCEVSDETNGHVNGCSGSQAGGASIDWAKEGSLPADATWYCDTKHGSAFSSIAMTGACNMTGAHFLYLMLIGTTSTITCVAVDAENDFKARSKVLSALEHWNLAKNIPINAYERMQVYHGKLSDPTLGLQQTQISHLDRTIDNIYHLDSEVSLLKNYENIRAGNVGALQSLISLARGSIGRTKSLHYLSTWGILHLQAWKTTQLAPLGWETGEKEMTNMKPGAGSTLGYLKCRWACESLLYEAARRGIPVNIFRSSMCAGSPESGVALPRTDINRRILEGSLQTGLVPDFGSDRGGGMSWITADFLASSILHLSRAQSRNCRKARIYHIVSDLHIPYTALGEVLGVSYKGDKLRSVKPEKWFAALRASGNVDMAVQAEVLETWCHAGWVPFSVDSKDTLTILKNDYGLVPTEVNRQMLMQLAYLAAGFLQNSEVLQVSVKNILEAWTARLLSKINMPAELADRVTFMVHDMFTEQPVKDADVYYFRWIFHDWSDKYCVKILKSLIPALKPGARIMFSERCLEPPCSLPLRQEKWNRDSDITMFAMSNSMERDQDQWEELLQAGDPRFRLEEVKRIAGAKLDMIIARWEGGA